MEDSNSSKKSSKTDFAGIVHDLKTPITSIMGYAELLKKGSHNEETKQEFYSIILSESERLLQMVNDILYSTKKEVVIQKCNINIQIKKYAQELSPLADKRNIEIVIKSNDSDVYVSVPENKMSRILTNIMENAIKYNREKGKVFIELNERNGRVYVKIKDTGIGIPKEDIEKIFDRHYRSKLSQDMNIEGSGLGLTIAKDIIEEYDGSIAVDSTVGESTEFVISFPISSVK